MTQEQIDKLERWALTVLYYGFVLFLIWKTQLISQILNGQYGLVIMLFVLLVVYPLAVRYLMHKETYFDKIRKELHNKGT